MLPSFIACWELSYDGLLSQYPLYDDSPAKKAVQTKDDSSDIRLEKTKNKSFLRVNLLLEIGTGVWTLVY